MPAATLRPATEADLARLEALARHPEVARTLGLYAVPSLSQALHDDDHDLLVIERAPGELAGSVRLFLRHQASRIVSVNGLMLDPAARGRGLGSAAVKALVDRVVAEQGHHRLEAEVFAFNEPALRAFSKAGFVEDGRRRRAYWRHGAWQDTVLFALVAEGDEAPR